MLCPKFSGSLKSVSQSVRPVLKPSWLPVVWLSWPYLESRSLMSRGVQHQCCWQDIRDHRRQMSASRIVWPLSITLDQIPPQYHSRSQHHACSLQNCSYFYKQHVANDKIWYVSKMFSALKILRWQSWDWDTEAFGPLPGSVPGESCTHLIFKYL